MASFCTRFGRSVRCAASTFTRPRVSTRTFSGETSARIRTTSNTVLIAPFLAGAITTWSAQSFTTMKETISSQGTSEYADTSNMLKAAHEIENALGDDSVSFDSDDLERHGFSEWSTSNAIRRPIAVVCPKTTEEVSIIARICNEHKTPMIPFGAGSSVEGNFSAPFSGISIDLSHMDKIVTVRADDMDVTVQAGVGWADLNAVLKNKGLFLPIDPSPTAQIGGMISTNASGPNAFKYGTMKDWVVNLTVVLADGSIIKTRRRPRKTSAGYNLNSLFTGSEGTLGIITEATVKLAPIPECETVATMSFASIRDAAAAAAAMVRRNIPLGALELMDDEQMKIINQNGGAGGKLWEEAPTLFLKFSGSASTVNDDATAAQKVAKEHGGHNFQHAVTETEKKNLWAARKEALWAMLAVRPEGTQIWSTDVAVPLSQLASIIEVSKVESSQLGLFSSILGHVGDGNFHQSVMYNPDVPEQKEAVKLCVEKMMVRALEMDGTISGEHGIGLGKKECLTKELSHETLNVMRMLKRSLDPGWLMNPGKIIDEQMG